MKINIHSFKHNVIKLLWPSDTKGKIVHITLLALIIAGAFIRLYRLQDFTIFLGDQGRDAIIIKRIATFEHFPAIGAPTSIGSKVGSVFLGPFYYYLQAPSYWIFGSNPAGQSVLLAFLSIISIIAVYFCLRQFYGKIPAIITAILIAFSYLMVAMSRFSWNPNPLPYFAFFAFYFFLQAIKAHEKKYYFLFGMFAALSLQLHYMYLASIVGYVICIIALFFWKKLKKSDISKFIIAGISFIIFISPLLIFDLKQLITSHFKNTFLNTLAFIALFTQKDDVVALPGKTNYFANFLRSTELFFGYLLPIQLPTFFPWLIILGITIGVVLYWRTLKDAVSRMATVTLLIIFTSSFAIISLYQGPKYEHYYTPVYYLFFAIVAIAIVGFIRRLKLVGWAFAIIVIGMYSIINLQHLDFVRFEPNRQILHAEKIAKVVFDNLHNDKYALTTLPDKYNDYTFRYFLEVWGKRPTQKDSYEKADELFVICEQACKPIGDGQWDIAYFAPTKIAQTWKVENVTIYRLTH